MRVAVVGLGYWGPNHVRNLLQLEACDSVVAVDLDPKRAAAVAAAHGRVTTAPDVDAVLADPSIAAVVVSTPVATHAELAERVLRSGRSVLVEKPLATTREGAQRLVDLAREKSLLVSAGHTFVHVPAVLAVQDLVRRGELGELLYLQGSRVNLGLHDSDVSVIWDLAPHDLSILLEWVDERPCAVSAHGRASSAGRTADVAFLDLEFPSGFVANLHVSWLAPTKVRNMTLVGSQRMVVYRDNDLEEPVKVYDKGVDFSEAEDFGRHKVVYRTGDVVSPRIAAWEPLRRQLDVFLTRVAGGETPDEREDKVVAIVGVLEAAQRSLEHRGRLEEL